jgi:hypothetical protein
MQALFFFAGIATVSGLNDMDYPSVNGLVSSLSNVKHVTVTNKVPIPPEVLENFCRILLCSSVCVVAISFSIVPLWPCQGGR